jgi:hypothetical protein
VFDIALVIKHTLTNTRLVQLQKLQRRQLRLQLQRLLLPTLYVQFYIPKYYTNAPKGGYPTLPNEVTKTETTVRVYKFMPLQRISLTYIRPVQLQRLLQQLLLLLLQRLLYVARYYFYRREKLTCIRHAQPQK